MNFSSVYERQKRNPNQMYNSMHTSAANYWTGALHKSEMKQEFSDDIYHNFHLIPDPLKKNLADTLFTNEEPKKPDKMGQYNQRMPVHTLEAPEGESTGSTLGGIGNFFSGVLNVLAGVMFRTKAPVSYYDCFDDSHQGSPQGWQNAKTNLKDKNGQPAQDRKSYDVPPSPNLSTEMNPARTVASCENKLNQVFNLLAPRHTSSPVWVRKRPKKVFIEPGSVSDSFEDAYSPEDFINLPDDPYIEYYSPVLYHNTELYETAAQKTLLNTAPIKENIEIVADVTNKSDLELQKDNTIFKLVKDNLETDKGILNLEQNNTLLDKCDLTSEKDKVELGKDNLDNKQHLPLDNNDGGINCQLVTNCEDKLSRLKALLQERHKKTPLSSVPDTHRVQNTKMIPIEKRAADKHFKNPNRRTNKRQKMKLKCKIEDDLLFANELSLGTPPSIENSPQLHPNANFGEYFNEVSGRFRSASIGSEDSFQIVFKDSPKEGRIRTSSDCDSEDSFIVFEDSPESLYTSNDVFGDSDDSDSDVSDSGCGTMTCKLAHSLTRTLSNLADDSLYVESEDEVDFANVEDVTIGAVTKEVKNPGLLLDDKKKQQRKSLPAKKVQFSAAPPKVHVMRVWAFAARQARAGHWERYAVDRERFKRRIADVDVAVSWVLRPQHRRRIMFQRFMPWWNQLKRKELADKKEREAEEKLNEERQKELEAKENLKEEPQKELETEEGRKERQKVEVEEKVKAERQKEVKAEEVSQNEEAEDKEEQENLLSPSGDKRWKESPVNLKGNRNSYAEETQSKNLESSPNDFTDRIMRLFREIKTCEKERDLTEELSGSCNTEIS